MKKKLSLRVRHVALAPYPRKSTPIFKIKKKPRGKSFEPGNRYGLATRFRKGEVANPNGRPSFKTMNAACRDRQARIVPREEIVAAGLPLSLFGMSYAAMNAWILSQEGLRGSIQAIAELTDRSEGRAAVSVTVDGEQSPLAILIASMDARSDQAGLAEGNPKLQKQLTGVNRDGSGEEGTAR